MILGDKGVEALFFDLAAVVLHGEVFRGCAGDTVGVVFHKEFAAEESVSGGDFKEFFGIIKGSGAAEGQSHIIPVAEFQIDTVGKTA